MATRFNLNGLFNYLDFYASFPKKTRAAHLIRCTNRSTSCALGAIQCILQGAEAELIVTFCSSVPVS